MHDLPCDYRVRVLSRAVVGRRMPVSDFRLAPDMIGANNYSDYDPEYCDGHFCPRDCDRCSYNEAEREEATDGEL